MTKLELVKLPPLGDGDRDALARAAHGDPFNVLGPHDTPLGPVVRAFLPGAREVELLRRSDHAVLGRLQESEPPGLFQGLVQDRSPYLFRIAWPDGNQETEDPYAFGPLLGELDLHLFGEGRHFQLAGALGANVLTIDGVAGVRFAV